MLCTEKLGRGDKMIKCCDEEMLISNGWYHCKKCYKRLIEVPHNKETNIIAQMLVEYVAEYDVGWTTLQHIIHELWKQGHYEGYEPKIHDGWNTSIDVQGSLEEVRT